MLDTPLLFDISDWSLLTLTGPDRQSYLHSFSTNDIKKLPLGAVCETFIPDHKGRILGHGFVVNHSEKLDLISVPGSHEVLFPHLSKYLLGVEAEVADRSAVTSFLCLVGETTLTSLGFPEELRLNRACPLPSEGADSEPGATWTVVRVDLTNFPTYVIYGPQEKLESLSHRLLSRGFTMGERGLFDQLRIAAGFPMVGQDLSDANIAQEAARTTQAISFNKGCYLGQEPIARLDAMGHTNKELRGFLINADDVPPDAILLAEEKEVGKLTSVADYAPGKSIGLGIIRAKYAQAGSSVAVVTSSGTFPATVYWPRLPVDVPSH